MCYSLLTSCIICTNYLLFISILLCLSFASKVSEIVMLILLCSVYYVCIVFLDQIPPLIQNTKSLLLQGYKYPRAYIATQGPMQNTTGDLWRMVWEFKSKVMVLLCALSEDGQEVCHPFWPNNEGDTAKFGRMTVTLQSETSFGDFTSRKLLVQGEQVHQNTGVT